MEWNGAGPDCFRHYEMMVEGNIVLVPDVESLRSFMGGLPVFYLGEACAMKGFTRRCFSGAIGRWSVKKRVVSVRVELDMNLTPVRRLRHLGLIGPDR